MSTLSLFGFTHGDLQRACVDVELALDVRLESHDSFFIGPCYSGSLSGGQLLLLRHNDNPLFDEQSDPPHERLEEPDFSHARLLLYVHGLDSKRAGQLLAHVADISFLAERDEMDKETYFEKLIAFLKRVPGISEWIGKGRNQQGLWWVKFAINIDHPLAWYVVQGLGFVLNNVSFTERLPTVFMPVSPPPYLNEGPRECSSWVIESKDTDFSPDMCVEWLESRLPQPVDDPSAWPTETV